MNNIYTLRDVLYKELSDYGDRETLNVDELNVVDTLAHALKNVDRIIMDEDDMDGGSYDNRYSRNRGSYNYGGSYARGRMNAKRNSMGRYSRYGGYSRAEEEVDNMIGELQGMMQGLPPEKQQEVQQFIQNMQSM